MRIMLSIVYALSRWVFIDYVDFFILTKCCLLYSVANLVEELIRDANSRQYQYVLIGLLSLKIIIYYGMAIVSLEKALLVSKPMRWDVQFLQ